MIEGVLGRREDILKILMTYVRVYISSSTSKDVSVLVPLQARACQC